MLPHQFHPYALQQQQQGALWGAVPAGGAGGGGEGLAGAAGVTANANSSSKGQGYAGKGLPQELASDGEMVALHQQHMRQMTVLQMELDQAKGQTELQQVRQQLAALMGNKVEPGKKGRMCIFTMITSVLCMTARRLSWRQA
jgi:hypothetical protein